jgi:hypothetical protein
MGSMSLNRHMSKEAEMVMLEFASFMLVQLYMAQLLVPSFHPLFVLHNRSNKW